MNLALRVKRVKLTGYEKLTPVMNSPRLRPAIFFDTSICVSVARGNISQAEWATVWKYLMKRYDYAISATTIGEIMVGIAKGDAQYFDENRKPLKVLYPTHKHVFLRLPGHFVMEKVLGDYREYPGGEPSDLKRMVRTVLAAVSKGALQYVGVVLPERPNERVGYDLDAQATMILKGKEAFAETFQKMRVGAARAPTPVEAARGWMAVLGKVISDAEALKLADALDAAYHHEQKLHALAKQGDYDFTRHSSDWIDGQQLLYLSDPNMHFLVRDKKLKEWTDDSAHADRILLYNEVRSLALNLNL